MPQTNRILKYLAKAGDPHEEPTTVVEMVGPYVGRTSAVLEDLRERIVVQRPATLIGLGFAAGVLIGCLLKRR